MYSPHDPERGPSDLVEGFAACEHLPQNDSPAEYVTLLTVVTACNSMIEVLQHNINRRHVQRKNVVNNVDRPILREP